MLLILLCELEKLGHMPVFACTAVGWEPTRMFENDCLDKSMWSSWVSQSAFQSSEMMECECVGKNDAECMLGSTVSLMLTVSGHDLMSTSS